MSVLCEKRDLISITDCTRSEWEEICRRAHLYKQKMPKDLLAGKLLASCFFEPSTRTRFSFESAMKRLGGDVMGFASEKEVSTQKGETLQDTIRVIGQMVDLLVLRHPMEGAARIAAESTSAIVINGGDGANEHPTQTLLDLFSIEECQGRIDGLSIACMGDLRHARTIHSLLRALAFYEVRLFFISPPELTLSEEFCDELRSSSIPFSFHHTFEEVRDRVDILYVTRVQKERFASLEQYERLKERYSITPALLQGVKDNLNILHPLPRVHEITPEVDQTPYSYYFEQSKNGLYVRAALLTWMMGI